MIMNYIPKMFSYSVINSLLKQIPRRYIGINYKSCSRLLSTESKSERKRPFILGIETSCDDTGCAIVDGNGNILGDALHSQHLTHVRNGGIMPPLAEDLHRTYIESIVEETFKAAGMNGHYLDAIAVTAKPGLPLSLVVGIKYAKYLARKFSKPIIPIHHMEAHALTVRMENPVEYPFLVLLVSGGHCLLALAKDVDDFKLLGKGTDDAPGEIFDKVARRLKLRNMEGFSALSGGAAIEYAATKANNPNAFDFPLVLARYRNCDFSFSGLKNKALRHLMAEEKELGIVGDGIIPGVYDLCAGLQLSVTRHLCHRTLRAMLYLERMEMLPDDKKTLVVSGGVACNNFLFKSLEILGDQSGYKVVRPRPKLCTDNGIMIAWNGVERWNRNIGIVHDIESVVMMNRCPLGEDITKKVANEEISCKCVSLNSLL
ncbi:threonyl-carbamoyl synthesis 4 [Arctopsyche grandis]|uniref:threonyl-carbamoyl synthesis 4 n=1 Tax=Arctopsyche grandis TaxID=121162 RepID=UPI00406D7C7F